MISRNPTSLQTTFIETFGASTLHCSFRRTSMRGNHAGIRP
jgi:hypothetical protein